MSTITLNSAWRPIVAAALEFYLSEFIETTESYDNDDMLSALIEDLYTLEADGMSQVTQLIDKTLGANFTTNSTSYVAVTDTDISHTFTKSNAMIRYHNISGSNSGANGTFCRAAIVGEGASFEYLYANNGTTARQGSCAAFFENLPIGTSKTIRLECLVSAGNGTISASMRLGIEIVEWD